MLGAASIQANPPAAIQEYSTAFCRLFAQTVGKDSSNMRMDGHDISLNPLQVKQILESQRNWNRLLLRKESAYQPAVGGRPVRDTVRPGCLLPRCTATLSASNRTGADLSSPAEL